MKPRLAISFSGGRSSAVMLWLCLSRYSATHDILITFSNTGCEHPATLDFVDAVDRHFTGGRVVWIEPVFHSGRKGPTAKIVDYETASRNGEPFRAAIEKHGIFCRTHPSCTSRLKEEPMISHRRAVGWGPGTYDVAIGIRADEADRMSPKRREKRFIYPLVSGGWTKKRVNNFMANFDWDLKLPSDAFGNCVWCWKKSTRKLMTVALNDPRAFDFPAEMERKHGWKSNGKPNKEPRVFFRGRLSAHDIIDKAVMEDFEEYRDALPFDPSLDVGEGCGESCEVGADDS